MTTEKVHVVTAELNVNTNLVEFPASPNLITPALALAHLQAVEAELNTILVERQSEIRACMLALLARQNLVMLGVPGVGKSFLVSEIARRITHGANGLANFSLLMTKFTTPEEVFGPVSVNGLKQDLYVRATANRLPEAHFTFLDEIFKSSSAILNALLTVLNERQYDNGGTRIDLPLVSVFGASNEMPEGEELNALWDRFQLRLMVQPVSAGGRSKLIRMALQNKKQRVAPAAFLGLAELEMLQYATELVDVPESVLKTYEKLLTDAEKVGITISDRKSTQLLSLVQAHALIEGRQQAEDEDLAVLEAALWNTPEQQADVKKLVSKLANPVGAKASELLDQADSVFKSAMMTLSNSSVEEDKKSETVVQSTKKISTVLKSLLELTPEYRTYITNSTTKSSGVSEALDKVTQNVAARPATKVERAIQSVNKMRQDLVTFYNEG